MGKEEAIERKRTRIPVNVPWVDELAGYVTRERAMNIMGLTSAGYLLQLVQDGKVQAVRLDSRTLLYDRRSVERFHRERSPRKSSATQETPPDR